MAFVSGISPRAVAPASALFRMASPPPLRSSAAAASSAVVVVDTDSEPRSATHATTPTHTPPRTLPKATCCICLDDRCFRSMFKLHCAHAYCVKCINEWRSGGGRSNSSTEALVQQRNRNACPQCRAPMSPEDIRKLDAKVFQKRSAPSPTKLSTEAIHAKLAAIQRKQSAHAKWLSKSKMALEKLQSQSQLKHQQITERMKQRGILESKQRALTEELCKRQRR